ncbi:MAG: hypothetical protein DMF61_11245 [Blastocatellia bacterium AA13]|nr:MAG: hypothetical protein DMF61_11245 [Blastocatellia bacterium AA13]
MGLSETVIIYLIIGGGVAMALVIRANTSGFHLVYLSAVGLIFWPIMVPTLFERSGSSGSTTTAPVISPIARRISELEAELKMVMAKTDGWAERVLATETEKITSLVAAMRGQAARVEEMERLLRAIEREPSKNSHGSAPVVSLDGERSRRKNVELLRRLRDKSESGLWTSITKIEDLISMIYVARFAGASRSEVDRMLAEISATVESISAVAIELNQLGE